MWIALETAENQYGEIIETETLCINEETGKITLNRLACWSAISLGLGTCRCVNHDTWEECEISPDYARELVRKSQELSEDKKKIALRAIAQAEQSAMKRERRKQEFYRRNPLQFLLDHFGFESVEEFEEALSYAYRLGLNPLPKIREALEKGGLKDWKVVWWYGDEGYAPDNTILIRETAGEDEPSCIQVEVGYYQAK